MRVYPGIKLLSQLESTLYKDANLFHEEKTCTRTNTCIVPEGGSSKQSQDTFFAFNIKIMLITYF